ncbi:MAG TPA: trigger factor [Chromatiales bacterium]|nr:trigger factor [Chromatiales bacterium]
MQVSVEEISEVERRMTVEVPAEQVTAEVESRLRELRGRVRLNGFRPGKVPLKVVRQRFGQSVLQEVAGELLQSSFQEAVAQEKLQPAGAPRIEPVQPKMGEALSYTATFEVYPDIALAELSDLTIREPQVEITEADVDAMIDKLREQHKRWEPVERPAQQGDQVVIDFEGSIDGEPFEGGKAEDYTVQLGEGRMIAGFEAQLEGARPGEERTIEVTFPEDYPRKQLAGKQASFRVKVKEVREPRLPEVDEEFARQFGIESGSVEELRADVRKNMERELKQAVRARIKQQVMDALLARHQFPIPQSLIDEEVRQLKAQSAANMPQGVDVTQLPDEPFVEDARRRVALGLIIGRILREQDIQLDQARVEAALDELAATYEDPEMVKNYFRSNREQMAGIEAMVLEDQVVDWVREQAASEAQPMSFDELMAPAGQGAAAGTEQQESKA